MTTGGTGRQADGLNHVFDLAASYHIYLAPYLQHTERVHQSIIITVSHFSYAPLIKCKITRKLNVIYLF